MSRLTSARALKGTLILCVGLIAGSLVGGTALAAGPFSDVPDDHPFRSDIEWMAQHEIAGGFPDGTYRGGQPVSRQAMAAFIRRTVDALHVEEEQSDPLVGVDFHGDADCAPDERALAGGGFVNLSNITISESYPSSDGSRWNITMETDDNVVLDPSVMRVWVLCAPKGVE